jgi:hypothetical protein
MPVSDAFVQKFAMPIFITALVPAVERVSGGFRECRRDGGKRPLPNSQIHRVR